MTRFLSPTLTGVGDVLVLSSRMVSCTYMFLKNELYPFVDLTHLANEGRTNVKGPLSAVVGKGAFEWIDASWESYFPYAGLRAFWSFSLESYFLLRYPQTGHCIQYHEPLVEISQGVAHNGQATVSFSWDMSSLLSSLLNAPV